LSGRQCGIYRRRNGQKRRTGDPPGNRNAGRLSPCPYLNTFINFLEKRYKVEVVAGTHPIPKKYLELHTSLGTWEGAEWQPLLAPTMADEATRQAYD